MGSGLQRTPHALQNLNTLKADVGKSLSLLIPNFANVDLRLGITKNGDAGLHARLINKTCRNLKYLSIYARSFKIQLGSDTLALL